MTGGRRVLVIEDNVDAAESLSDALSLFDHRVEVALTGPDGLEKARAFDPEVVICDIGLPGMDGYAVAKALRGEPRYARTYLIALSGYAFEEDVARALAAGFDRHMTKPPELSALEKVIAEAARR
jgi:CheY-like chemotaxis protein